MSTDAERIAALEKQVAALQSQVANDHSIIRDLHEQQKLFYKSLTALQQAFDAVCVTLDPNFKPEPQVPPRSGLM